MSHGNRIPDPGQRIPATARHHVISPVDGSVYTEFDLPSGAEIEATVERAVRSQETWKHVPLADRTAILWAASLALRIARRLAPCAVK